MDHRGGGKGRFIIGLFNNCENTSERGEPCSPLLDIMETIRVFLVEKNTCYLLQIWRFRILELMKRKDFAISWFYDKKNEDIFFIEVLKKECKARGMSFMLVDEANVRQSIKKLKEGKLKFKFLLDMVSELTDPKDHFAMLSYAAKDTGTKVINDPDYAKAAADKSITHFDLLKVGIAVPYTVILRTWEPAKRISGREKRKLGSSFVIKPALGYGWRGVKIGAKGTLDEISKAKKISRGENLLLQKNIKPVIIEGRIAWFRVFHVFGEIIPCWWNTGTGHYEHVTLRKMHKHRLRSLTVIVSEIAKLKNIEWFSTEITITLKGKKRWFVVIDYVNDQCDLKSQSMCRAGVPDNLIEHIAYKIVENAWLHKRGKYKTGYRSIFCAKAFK